MKTRGLLMALTGILVVGAGLGVCAQSFGGSWEFDLRILQTPSFRGSTFTLDYNVETWMFMSQSVFTQAGFEEQIFLFDGMLGAVLLSGGLAFSSIDWSPLPLVIPLDYAYAWMDVSCEISGVALLFSADHFSFPWGFIPADIGSPDVEWPCSQTESYLLFTFGLQRSPVSLAASVDACCGTLAFKEVGIGFSGFSVCDVSTEATLKLSCDGFEYIKIALDDVVFPNVNWLSFDMSVTFETESKTVSVEPTLNTFGTGCFEFYGDIVSPAGGVGVDSIEFQGLKLYWEFTPWQYVECLYAAAPEAETFSTLFWDYEFEYVKFGFAGPSCCGGEFIVDLGAFFWDNPTEVTVFDISRIVGSFSYPLANLTVNVSFSFQLTGGITLDLGWLFVF